MVGQVRVFCGCKIQPLGKLPGFPFTTMDEGRKGSLPGTLPWFFSLQRPDSLLPGGLFFCRITNVNKILADWEISSPWKWSNLLKNSRKHIKIGWQVFLCGLAGESCLGTWQQWPASNPLVTIATFLGRSYLNLQGMWSMVKTEFHFFCLFFKL